MIAPLACRRTTEQALGRCCAHSRSIRYTNIHGLGFASSLSSIPFPKHQFLFALLGFNFGVDFGQLFVIGLAFLAVGWYRNKPWFRPRIAIPCSVAIAAVGVVWAAQRLAAG